MKLNVALHAIIVRVHVCGLLFRSCVEEISEIFGEEMG